MKLTIKEEFNNEVYRDLEEQLIEDFYKLTRGYYYYTFLSLKIIQAMEISLAEFLQKNKQSELDFDSLTLVGTYFTSVVADIFNKIFAASTTSSLSALGFC